MTLFKQQTNNTILFRVDGGKVWGISMGHIRRSLILAKALSDKYRTIFIMKNYPDGVSYVRNFGIEIETIGIHDNIDQTLINLCKKYSPRKIVFDLYSNPYTTIFEYAHAENIQTIVFDTLGQFFESADILINDAFHGNSIRYSGLDKRTKLYLGPKYFLVDSPQEIMPIRETVKDIMITMGGSDPADLTLKIINSLLEYVSNCNINIHVVLGPSFTEDKKIYNLAKPYVFIKVYKNPLNFLKLMSRQDIVISAAGRTLYECAYFGRPVIIVPSIEHEVIIANEYSNLTSCFPIGIWDDGKSSRKIVGTLENYINNYQLRKFIFQRSSVIFDASGLKRILAALRQ